jgi:adenine deaminase
MGVVTSINSDDAEMARRLNQEAAKVVKYGRISEEEAWKMVTLNPARLLLIDHRVGSIKAGKDADVVLWSDNPLSIYARAEATWVDGIRYYDQARDLELRQRIAEERQRLVQKMMTAKANGASTRKPGPSGSRLYHCDDVDDELDGHHGHGHSHNEDVH